MIDFHCHLDLYSNPNAIARRCNLEKLRVLSVTTVPSAFQGTLALAQSADHIHTALGLHPELVASRHRELPLFEALLNTTRFVGEVGLDGSYRHRSSLAQQESILRDILRLCARAGGRIISMHSRGAASKILDVLSDQPNAGTFILHWYLGKKRDVERAVELGCWFSVNPTMLSTANGRSAVAAMPPDKVIPESDGPFGTVGGRPANPWDAWSVVPDLASLWGTSADDVAALSKAAYSAIVYSKR
jgi:TatD DNase family protein